MKPLVKDATKLLADVLKAVYSESTHSFSLSCDSIKQDVRKEKRIDFEELVANFFHDLESQFNLYANSLGLFEYQDQELNADATRTYEELKNAFFAVRKCQHTNKKNADEDNDKCDGECNDDVDVYFATDGGSLVLCENHARKIPVVVWGHDRPMNRQYYEDIYSPYTDLYQKGAHIRIKKELLASRICKHMGDCDNVAVLQYSSEGEERIVLCGKHQREVNLAVFGTEKISPEQSRSEKYRSFVKSVKDTKR